ncbi:uncharacterized protein LOC143055969 [Mytilus galloprovincialis]|uniref:uncharacterized protein LOC143055969 n=1 Tax=Mytilus galloprovincialis TaxID=29158 RepID=UPI003F7B847C
MSALSHEKITPCRKRPTQRDYTTNTFSAPTCKKRLIDTDMSCTLTQGELVQGPLDSLAEKNIDVSDVENIDPIEDKSFYGVEPLDMLAMAAENKALTENYAKLVLENVNLQQQLSSCKKKKKEKSIIIEKSFGCEKLNSKEYQYYTGFSKDRFEDILKFLVPREGEDIIKWTKAVSGSKQLSTKDQLLLVMIKLRQNFDFSHIANLFNLSTQDCSVIFLNWINYMFHRLGSLVIWPHRDHIIEHMPPTFKQDFPNSLVIIDGTEVKIQKPSSLHRQSQCYSDYKSCTTLKGLVGVDPRGSITFSSMLFAGSISDKEITKESGFYRLLKDLISSGKVNVGDGVMADKGFTIEKELKEIGLQLNIPPFASSGSQMKSADVNETIKIAKHRVHVERAIARVKQFKILSGRINLSLFSSVNQIWLTCCLLTNFMPFLIQDNNDKSN